MKQKATRQEWWCSISYYELADRVGEVWNAPTSMPNIVIDGYTNPNDGAGAPNRFSLGLLTNINRRPESDNSRRYIGKGCSIVTENNNVWLMNDSESSIFVQVMCIFINSCLNYALIRAQSAIWRIIGIQLLW